MNHAQRYWRAIRYYDRFKFIENSQQFDRMDLICVSYDMTFQGLMAKLRHSDKSWAGGLI